jgi:hypothetical protein
VQEHRLVTTRRARYYTIGGGEQPLSEAWIVLHGLGQLASVFIEYFQSIASPGRLIVAPEALNRYYVTPGASGRTADAKVGATWMTRMDRENEIADYVDFLDAVWRETSTGAARVTGSASRKVWRQRVGGFTEMRVDRLIAGGGSCRRFDRYEASAASRWWQERRTSTQRGSPRGITMLVWWQRV